VSDLSFFELKLNGVHKLKNKRQCVALPEVIFNRFMWRRRNASFVLENAFSAEFSLFPLFKNSAMPTGKK